MIADLLFKCRTETSQTALHLSKDVIQAFAHGRVSKSGEPMEIEQQTPAWGRQV
jgi:hypothetical protein